MGFLLPEKRTETRGNACYYVERRTQPPGPVGWGVSGLCSKSRRPSPCGPRKSRGFPKPQRRYTCIRCDLPPVRLGCKRTSLHFLSITTVMYAHFTSEHLRPLSPTLGPLLVGQGTGARNLQFPSGAQCLKGAKSLLNIGTDTGVWSCPSSHFRSVRRGVA